MSEKMRKCVYQLDGVDQKKSISAQKATEHFESKLSKYRHKTMQPCQKPTIIIDNGSYEARAGWSFESIPFLRFRNLVAKPKTSVNKAIDAMHLVGDEINEFEISKVAKRSMFDKNVVFHIQSLEHMLDYTFSHLGLATDSSIDYPLLFTEPMCNPNYSRGLVSELMFECYHVPALSYAVDSMLAWHYNT